MLFVNPFDYVPSIDGRKTAVFFAIGIEMLSKVTKEWVRETSYAQKRKSMFEWVEIGYMHRRFENIP